MKKAQINCETLKGPIILFGLGIIKLDQLISKLNKWIWYVCETYGPEGNQGWISRLLSKFAREKGNSDKWQVR